MGHRALGKGPRTPREGSLWAPGAGLLVLLAVAAAGGAPWGVPLGRRAVKATIDAGGDSDSYLVEAHRGARLDVKLSVPRRSGLVPDVVLLAPGGEVLDAPFRRSARALRLRRFDVAQSGRYELRVTAAEGTSGDYAVSAKVKGAATVKIKGLRLAGGEERAFEFAAGGGASVAFTVRARPTAAGFVALLDPRGNFVPVPPGSIRANAAGRLAGKGITLPASGVFGPWRLIVRADGGPRDGVRVVIRARGGRLPASRGALPTDEPRLTAVTPTEVGVSTPVRITGVGLVDGAKGRPLRLFMAGAEAIDVTLESETTLRGVVPPGITGAVDVAILNGDGHAAVLRDALLVVPPPRPTSFEPQRGPAVGGTTVLVRGSGFRPSSAVTLAGTAFGSHTEFIDEGRLRFTTPPFAGGPQTLGVRDRTGQERIAPGTFDFVAAPFVVSVRPPLVPRLADEIVTLGGGGFTAQQTVTIGGTPPDAITLRSAHEMMLRLPLLALGAHDVLVRDPLDQTSLTPGGVTVFTFAAGPSLDGTGGPPPTDMALFDYDDDGDLDVFLIAEGGPSLSATSLLRVLQSNGAGGYTDVTTTVMPAPTDDDWRGRTIAFGDVAGDVGSPPPDGRPDLVIGTMDDSVLPATRSRVRILANRAAPDGSRVFVDRTSVVMSAPSNYDDWRAADLWIGDLDGDGGIDDIVATHDEIPEGVSPLSPYYVYYLSGTRIFSFATPQGGGYGAFAWQSRRMPHVIGTKVQTPGFVQCGDDACRDTFTPFTGTSLAVTDLDGDGRRDIAVTSPGVVTVNGAPVTSTQIARSEVILGLDVMTDETSILSHAIAPLRGDILLSGDVIGDGAEDLVVVRSTVGAGLSVDVVENRGFARTWGVRSDDLLPGVDGCEHLQADAAQLVDIDGDGDLDLVLLVVAPPTAGATTTGLGLRLLRNGGESGFSRELEELIPRPVSEDWSGRALAVGDGPGGPLLVIARPNSAGTGTDVRSLSRVTSD